MSAGRNAASFLFLVVSLVADAVLVGYGTLTITAYRSENNVRLSLSNVPLCSSPPTRQFHLPTGVTMEGFARMLLPGSPLETELNLNLSDVEVAMRGLTVLEKPHGTRPPLPSSYCVLTSL